MIVEEHPKMANDQQLRPSEDDLPSYDFATHAGPSNGNQPIPMNPTYPKDNKLLSTPHVSISPGAGPSMPPTAVYHYQNPITAEHVVSLLPPDHPEMICLQAGEHTPETNFGILGILAAILWFPLGIGLCLLDRRVKCSRCGRQLESGLCQ